MNQPPEDYEDSKLIVKRLAKFHAATYFLANEKVFKKKNLASQSTKNCFEDLFSSSSGQLPL
jgi:hypothetical protein